MHTADIKALDQQYILQTYNRYPIALVRGAGIKVWDANGKEYLDFLGGIAVNPLGHCHPKVVAAIIKQAQTLCHVSNLYFTEPAVKLAQLLVQQGGLDKVFFCNSGAEANEAAIKLARKYQWRNGNKNKYEIVGLTHSFHGRTLATLAATDKPEIKEGFGPLPSGFKFVAMNNITALEKAVNENTAAVIIEPVQGEGGIHLATMEFLTAVRKLCDKFNAVLIFDEIQCGLGRTGKLFAYQNYNIKPDLITLAKGIANGLPLGGLCATNKIATGFQYGDHATTFGGNPVATTAALAVLQTILEENILQNVIKQSNYLFNQLQQLRAEMPEMIGEIRGAGLMIGIELKIDAKKTLQNCHEQGLLANVTAGNVLRLLPPYIVTQENIDKALEIIEASITCRVT